MQVRRRMQAPATAQTLGKQPTNSQKLIYIAQKLGLNGIKDMQGSTVNIFDTVLLTLGSAPQTLEFFQNAQNKTRQFSNFQNGSLNSGETLVMEEIKFWLLRLSGGGLTSTATQIANIIPLNAVPAAYMSRNQVFQQGMISVSIANQTVIKDYLISEVDPQFNPATTGIINALVPQVPPTTDLSNTQFTGNTIIKLESPPVLPPNQKLKVTLEIGPTGSGIGDTLAICCSIGKFGSIYASKTTL